MMRYMVYSMQSIVCGRWYTLCGMKMVDFDRKSTRQPTVEGKNPAWPSNTSYYTTIVLGILVYKVMQDLYIISSSIAPSLGSCRAPQNESQIM